MIRASSILEAYHGLFRTDYKTTYTVFVNPSSKELRELTSRLNDPDVPDGVRFIADNSAKKVYAWEGMYANHDDARRHVGLKCDPSMWSDDNVCGSMLDGWAEQQGSRFFLQACDVMEANWSSSVRYRQTIFSQDWSWVDRYIQVTPYLERLKKEFHWPE